MVLVLDLVKFMDFIGFLKNAKMCTYNAIVNKINRKTTKIIEIIENLTNLSAALKIDQKITIFIAAGVLVGFCKKCAKNSSLYRGILHDLRPVRFDLIQNRSILARNR